MNTSARAVLYGILGLIVLVLVVWFAFSLGGSGQNATTTPGATTTPPLPEVTSVGIALLDTAPSATSTGKSRGCDKVLLVPFPVATTSAPLTAALNTLFSLSTTSVSGLFNFLDRTNETLQFDRAEVVDDTARIYLTGSLSGLAGVCDDPRAQAQIEETALQFSSVQSVELYLNGTRITSLAPSMK